MKARHISELAWVIGGQAATAVGTLLGVRLLTQYLKPEAFGTLSLALGITTLVLSVTSTPMTQAAMHYFPTAVREGRVARLSVSLWQSLRPFALVLISCAAGSWAAYWLLDLGWAKLTAVIALLLLIDGQRAVHLSLLNSSRQQARFAIWTTLDAWLRPLLGVAAICLLGDSAYYVLGAHCIISFALFKMLSNSKWPPHLDHTAREERIHQNLWHYALPLIPLGVLAWANNLGDRYLIGATLGLAEAGTYAAIYGLSSMPFMAVGGTLEQALRPVYQAAIASGNQDRARAVFRSWLAAVLGVSALGVAIVFFTHRWIAAVFLGAAYQHAANLMPWIALGYALRCTAYVFERACYAHAQTRQVLFIQLAAAAIALIATPVGALGWGILGAAIAVPVYFAVQLAMAIYYAKGALGRGVQALAVGAF